MLSQCKYVFCASHICELTVEFISESGGKSDRTEAITPTSPAVRLSGFPDISKTTDNTSSLPTAFYTGQSYEAYRCRMYVRRYDQLQRSHPNQCQIWKFISHLTTEEHLQIWTLLTSSLIGCFPLPIFKAHPSGNKTLHKRGVRFTGAIKPCSIAWYCFWPVRISWTPSRFCTMWERQWTSCTITAGGKLNG